MIGRAACEMVLHLVGGSHRLNPQNTHQRPTVAILCGSHVQGAQGVNCGRHLANHCAIVTILSPPQKTDSLLSSELKLFNLSCGKTVNTVSDLPSTVDIIVDALQSHDDSAPEATPLITSARQWAKQTRSPSLCLDPPPHVNCSSHNFILAPALPFGFKNDKCSVHICDIGLPAGVFSKAGCTYSSPFGSKFVVPLYPRTGDT